MCICMCIYIYIYKRISLVQPFTFNPRTACFVVWFCLHKKKPTPRSWKLDPQQIPWMAAVK